MIAELSGDSLVAAAMERLHPVHTVLDIGPGIRPQTLVNSTVHVCVEPYREYAERLAADCPGLVVLQCTWEEAIGLFPPLSVDTVVLMDVIEHLERDEAERLLRRTVGLARSQVVVQTPLGFMPQGEGESVDAWGLGGVEWQVHRSGWTPDDFPGWQVLVSPSFHYEDAYGRPLDEPHGAFFAILDKGAGFRSDALHGWIESVVKECEEIRAQYEQSVSWRVTKPLRWASRLLRGSQVR